MLEFLRLSECGVWSWSILQPGGFWGNEGGWYSLQWLGGDKGRQEQRLAYISLDPEGGQA